MTNQRPCPARREPDARPERIPTRVAESSPEHAAVLAGVEAGDAALVRSRSSGALHLFVGVQRSETTTRRLIALRTYAELRRVLLAEGYDVPVSSLVAEGFTATEIARFDRTIATSPSSMRTLSAASLCPAQTKIFQ